MARSSRSVYDPTNYGEIDRRRQSYEAVYTLLEQQREWRDQVKRTYVYGTDVNTSAQLVRFLRLNGYPPLHVI